MCVSKRDYDTVRIHAMMLIIAGDRDLHLRLWTSHRARKRVINANNGRRQKADSLRFN